MDYLKAIHINIKKTLDKHPILKPILLACLAYIFARFYWYRNIPKPILMKLSEFLTNVDQQLVSQVFMKGENTIVFKAGSHLYKTYANAMPKRELFGLLRQHKIPFSCNSNNQNSTLLLLAMIALASFSVFKLVNSITAKQQYQFKQNQSKIQPTTLKDVFGLQHAKEALLETIDFLKNPQKYIKIGCRLRKGIIFYGPPGTGKTLLAKATAGETGSQFIFCTASQFCEMYVGVGAKRIRELFEKARSYRSAIIFIDEIDAIGRRKTLEHDSADSERNSTLNQLLTEMDGFQSLNSVVVIAATNRLEMVDEALVRSGRFDRKVFIPLPNEYQRYGILKLHLEKKSSNVHDQILRKIAVEAVGLSGADLQSLTNEAAYHALKKQEDKDKITAEDIIYAYLQIRKSKIKY